MAKARPKKRFWIVSFCYDDAHIVEAESADKVLTNPLNTYRVYYNDLKYQYIDLNKEARDEAKGRKNQVDPEILCNPKTTLEDILAMPQMKDRGKDEADRKLLEASLGIMKYVPEEVKQKMITKYRDAQSKSEEQLVDEILPTLKQKKRDYLPEKIKNLTPAELVVALNCAGYVTGRTGFYTMKDALDRLYSGWRKAFSEHKRVELDFRKILGKI